jgi:hypothetical protein
MTHREAVLTLYAVAFVLGLLATFITQASVTEGYVAGGLVVLGGIYALWRLERPPFFKADPMPKPQTLHSETNQPTD